MAIMVLFQLGLWQTISEVGADAAESEPAISFGVPGGSNRCQAVTFSRDLRLLATKRVSGQVEVWEVAKGARLAQWQVGAAREEWGLLLMGPQMSFLADGSKLLVAGPTHVGIYDAMTGQAERICDGATGTVEAITVAPGGDRALGVFRNPAAELVFWSLPDGKLLSNLPTKPAPGEMPGQFRRPGRPGLPTGRPPTSIPSGFSYAFSGDGPLFAVGMAYGGVDLWNLADGKWQGALQNSGPASSSTRSSALTFLAEGKLAAVLNESKLVVYDLTTRVGATWQTDDGNPGATALEIRGLAASGDGKRCAIGGLRVGSRPGVFAPAGSVVFDAPIHAEVQVWDVLGAKRLVRFTGKPTEKFARVAMDATGRRVAAITTGVSYSPTMMAAMQQGAELTASGPMRVVVWDVPQP